MNRAMALVLVLGLVVFARRVESADHVRFATMALGFVLLAATLAGEAGERFRLPRLTLYIATGLCVGPSVLDLVTPAMASQLRLVNGLAVALIAFSAGLELDAKSLKSEGKSLVRHGGALVGLLFAGLTLTALLASPWLPIVAHASWSVRLAFALVLASVLTTFSPTVAMAVISDTGAKGPLSRRILQLVVAGDLAVVLLFTATTTAARLLDGGPVSLRHAFGEVSWELVGSILVGAGTGALVVLYRRFVDRRSTLFIAAVCLLVAEVGSRVGLSPILAALVAGFVVRQVAPDTAHHLERPLERLRMPLLVVFFSAAGASLHLDRLAVVGGLALLAGLVRAGLIFGANRIGARWGGVAPGVAKYAPLGLVSQAGVTLGLAVIVGRDFGEWGRWIEALVLACVSIHELVGPVAFRWALQRNGEIPEAPADPAAEPAHT